MCTDRSEPAEGTVRRIRQGTTADRDGLRQIQTVLPEPSPALLDASLVSLDENHASITPAVGPAEGQDSCDTAGGADVAGPAPTLPQRPLSALVCLVGTDPVGYCIAVDGPGVYLPELAVHPDHRRMGHGSALLGAVTERFDEREAIRLTVAVDNTAARAFYDHQGFERVDRLPDHFESGAGLLLERSR